MARGPNHGYFLDLTKSILVVLGVNFKWAKNFLHSMGLKVTTVSCYLGGYIGESRSYNMRLGEELNAWEGADRRGRLRSWGGGGALSPSGSLHSHAKVTTT